MTCALRPISAGSVPLLLGVDTIPVPSPVTYKPFSQPVVSTVRVLLDLAG